MNSKQTEIIFEDIREGILQQGIIVKALIDIIIEKELVTRDEFDDKVLEISTLVQDEITKLHKELDNLGDEEDIASTVSDVFYGKGGDA
jgi:hypothetical protein